MEVHVQLRSLHVDRTIDGVKGRHLDVFVIRNAGAKLHALRVDDRPIARDIHWVLINRDVQDDVPGREVALRIDTSHHSMTKAQGNVLIELCMIERRMLAVG